MSAARSILVIGGETPAGRGMTVGLAEAGTDVAITSLTRDTQAEFAINSALNEVWAIGRKGIAVAIDASNDDEVRRAFDQAETALGEIAFVVAVARDIDAARLRAVFAERTVLAVEPEADVLAALAAIIEVL
jgi:NAD(P)-dependent dehydrogenase (short-subunit alcohol dehydrogenase family)